MKNPAHLLQIWFLRMVSGGASVFGAFSGNTITVSGGAHVVYDEQLNALGVFLVASWNEI